MLRPTLLALTSVAVAAGNLAAIAQSDSPPQIRRLRANGVDLSYVEQGRGTPVLFVHGAATDLRYWEPQRQAFGDRYRFIAYSYRYHGTDPWPDDGSQYSLETHAADLEAFIPALKAGPVHLVGLSLGGAVASMVAIKAPQLVRTLTLAEPGLMSLLDGRPEGQAVLDEWNKGFGPVAAALEAGDNGLAIRHLGALVTGGTPDDFERLPPSLRQNLLDNARTLPLLMAAPPRDVTCEMLGTIKAPTLIVRGERTPRIFVQVNEQVGRCIEGSRQAVVANASHPMSVDNPAEFNRVVLEFLARSSPAPSREIE